jgi:hypothetical protein
MRTIVEKYSLVPGVGVVAYDPISMTTLMVGSMAASAAGGGISALGTLASGSAAKTAANFKAAQLRQNASQAIAANQRQALDTEQRTNLAISSATARAGASGVASDTGSPVTNTGAIAQRGSYQAFTQMFNGESTATGLENEAAGDEYTGEAQQDASYLAAGGQVASTAGNMMSIYGRYKFQTPRGPSGVSV